MKKITNTILIVLMMVCAIVALLTFIDMFYSLGVEDKIYNFLNSKVMRKYIMKILVICWCLAWIFVLYNVRSHSNKKI